MKIANKNIHFIEGIITAITFSFLLLLIQFLKSESEFYIFLVRNLFLAFIPYGITSLLSYDRINKKPVLFWFSFIIWLVLLPNSLYSFIYLQNINSSELKSSDWLDILVILSFVINGIIIGYASLRTMQHLLCKIFNKTITSIIIYLILLVSGYIIYLRQTLMLYRRNNVETPLEVYFDNYMSIFNN